MSLFSIIPLAEITSLALGATVSISALRDLLKSERYSHRLARLLDRKDAWKDFEKNQLRRIMKDHEVDSNELALIVEVVDRIAASDEDRSSVEIRAIYPSRSEKAKKLLISDMLSHSKEVV